MRVLGVVPARGGSKGIPGKNIRLLAGKPLLQYTAEAALASKRLQQTLLTTDDPQIASLGQKLGLSVPFLRPAALAQDNTPTLPVLLHLLEWLAQRGEAYDAYCLLQPTTPLRTQQHIDEAVALLAESKADSVVSVVPVPAHYHPAWQLQISENGKLSLGNGDPLSQIIPRRQALTPAYVRSGAIYVMRHNTLVEKSSLYGDLCLAYVMPAAEHVNIDSPEDWVQAEHLLKATLCPC